MPTIPQRDEVWYDLRPMIACREWRDSTKYRRIVVVTATDASYVEGSSSWQERRRGVWTAMENPPARKTRILAHVFARRFIRAEES